MPMMSDDLTVEEHALGYELSMKSVSVPVPLASRPRIRIGCQCLNFRVVNVPFIMELSS